MQRLLARVQAQQDRRLDQELAQPASPNAQTAAALCTLTLADFEAAVPELTQAAAPQPVA
ncbi:MAG: hypothetical protein EOO40_08720 [Deltaproteobacteria bacterium]|nr:MAG: hypothetical protein EOO40_08720 [Deltaproteobacteria bacterium]